jgi:hypothetical protein
MLLLGILALPGFVACDREGPAERTGKKIDKAAEDVKDAAKNAADEAKDAAE